MTRRRKANAVLEGKRANGIRLSILEPRIDRLLSFLGQFRPRGVGRLHSIDSSNSAQGTLVEKHRGRRYSVISGDVV